MPGSWTTAPILDHPRVIQVRSFSKIHAMAGFRVGYAVVPGGRAGPAARARRRRAGAGGRAVGGRAAAPSPRAGGARQARAQRERLAAEFDVAPGAGPYAWLRAPVAEALAARRIYVAPGTAWGDEEHVRVTLSDAAATERLLEALRSL